MSRVEYSFGDPAQFDEAKVASFVARLNELWNEEVHDHLQVSVDFRERLKADYGSSFDDMALMHANALEAIQWATNKIEQLSGTDPEEQAFLNYHHVVKGIAARALLTFSEVSWLLEGGYPNGALARVRTLQELMVIAGVLGKYGNPDGSHPQLVERFVRHREAFYLQTATDLIGSQVLDPEDLLDASTLINLTEKRTDLLKRYGSNFGTPWGWAAPLFPTNTRFGLTKLFSLLHPILTPLYGMASDQVHAGSEGWHDAFVPRADEILLPAGPTNLGLALPAHLAIIFLNGVLQAAVPTSINVKGEIDTTGGMLLVGITHVSDRAEDALAAGKRAVLSAEKEYQAKGEDGAAHGAEDRQS